MHYRSRTGRKGPYAAYYLQITPGNSFIGKWSAVLGRDHFSRGVQNAVHVSVIYWQLTRSCKTRRWLLASGSTASCCHKTRYRPQTSSTESRAHRRQHAQGVSGGRAKQSGKSCAGVRLVSIERGKCAEDQTEGESTFRYNAVYCKSCTM